MNRMKSKKLFSLFVAGLTLVSCATEKRTTEQMRAEWTKMNASKAETIQEFNQNKFGMFIHWGLYAIPGGIWKGNKCRGLAEWIQYSQKIPRAEYAQLSKEFNPVDFSASNIVTLAKKTGMKYLVFTAKHHDGFAMYDSKYSRYDIMDSSPYKKDIVQELYDACENQGLDFGLYYSQNLDWMDGSDAQDARYYADMKKANPDKEVKHINGANLFDTSPNTFEEYMYQKSIPQIEELAQSYPNMKQIWFDMPRGLDEEQSFIFYKTVYDKRPNVIVNSRVGNDFGDFEIPRDNQIPAEGTYTKPWQTIGTMNNSWGYKSFDHDWKSTKEVLFWLVEVVSKGGNYMLNIGPDAQGRVPEACVKSLLGLGEWMDINSAAIYGTTKWDVTHEGPSSVNMEGTKQRRKNKFNFEFTPEDFWFTQKGSDVYAIALTYPENQIARIKTCTNHKGKVKSVKMLGYEDVIEFTQDEQGLTVKLPDNKPNTHGYVLKLAMDN